MYVHWTTRTGHLDFFEPSVREVFSKSSSLSCLIPRDGRVPVGCRIVPWADVVSKVKAGTIPARICLTCRSSFARVCQAAKLSPKGAPRPDLPCPTQLGLPQHQM